MGHATAAVAGALAAAGRVQLLELLAAGERPVEALAAAAGQSIANASRHLQILRQVGLVEARREGRNVVCRLASPAVLEALRMLAALGERRLPGLERRAPEAPAEPEPAASPTNDEFLVDRDTLYRLARFGDAAVLDVRPTTEYRDGHVAGARSVPLERLAAWTERASPDRDVIVYSRGPRCPLAGRALEALAARGFRARRFPDGFADWKSAGLPVEEGG